MLVCVYVNVCECTCMFCNCLCVCTCAGVHACMQLCVHFYMCTYRIMCYVCVCVHVYDVCLCVHVLIFVYVCTLKPFSNIKLKNIAIC